MSCVRFDGILFGRNLARIVLVDLSRIFVWGMLIRGKEIFMFNNE